MPPKKGTVESLSNVIDHLYEPDRKKEFLKTMEAEQKFRDRVTTFSILAPHERELQKDIGEMTRKELCDGLADLGVSSYETLMLKVYHIHKYLEWYSEHIKPVPIHIYNISWQDIDLAPVFHDELIQDLRALDEDWPKRNPANGDLYKPIFVLSWYGFGLQEMCRLSRKEVAFRSDHVEINATDHCVRIDDPIAVRILGDYDSFTERPASGGAVRVRSNNSWFLYDAVRILPDEAFKGDKQVVPTTISSRIKAARFHQSKEVQRRYEIQSLRDAGIYNRCIEFENAKHRPVTDEEIRRITDKEIRDARRLQAFRLSVQKYREAFHLEPTW